MPIDILDSSSRLGYAMKNNNPPVLSVADVAVFVGLS